MSIQVVSDIHLEFFKTLPPIFDKSFVKAKYLFCAGDIGIPLSDSSGVWKRFIEWASTSYKKVFYVLGNHESYGHDYHSTISYIDEYFSNYAKNCVLLQKDMKSEIECDNGKRYDVYGCTLWSDMSELASDYLNDTKFIMRNEKHITHLDIQGWHTEDRDWLSKISLSQNCIVMTHHMPSYKLIHEDFRSPRHMKYASGFASHCEELINSKIWIFGHTHRHMDQVVNDTRCYANPLGYRGEEAHFNPKEVIQLD